MLPMDVFNADAFSATSLSTAIDKIDYVPEFLGTLPGLFGPDPVRTEVIWIEERTTGVVVLPFSPRGAPPHQTSGDKRKARAYRTLRFGDASRITASELLAIRAFGSEIDLKTLQSEVARRQMLMKQNFQLTKEFHRFNCVTDALVKDSDGSTLIDWAAEFSQTIPVELDFDLDNATPAEGAVRKKCTAVRRSIQVGLKGAGTAREIVGMCGDNFWDDLTSHPEVVKTFTNWAAAADLRNGHGQEWSSFRYGEITFVNYRGTDDGTTLGVGTDKCKFFPLGAGIFRWAMSPGERFEHLGQLGQDTYSAIVVDKDRNSYADVEAYSYPLPVCTMPQALHRARRT
jgi:hypothetical protein